MPNWTSNRLTIEGTSGELREFREGARGIDDDGAKRELSFSTLVPSPDQSRLGPTPAGSELDAATITREGGHLWRVVRWGTKWEADQVTVEEGPGSLIYEFETAWNAPFALLEEISGRFPGLRFILEYQDEGSDEEYDEIFLRCVFVNGEVTEADERAVEDIRRAHLPPLSGDPWIFYFYSHPEEFVKTPTLMAGDPPEEIREWVENQLIQEAVLEKLRETNPVQMRRPTDGDPETA